MGVTLPERTTYEPPPGTTFDASQAPSAHPGERGAQAPWSLAKRVGFRFAFAYFVLYLLPFPISRLPIPGNPAQYWGKLSEALALWTETHLFGLPAPVPIVPTGSGDTMAAFAENANWLMLALGIALVWSILDRRRARYERLDQWLHVYVRFGLATIMFGYGFAKIIPTQMPAPTLERLVQPWGEFSPMGVLWSFMGFSSVYQIFTGIGEALGAFLLVFRRTATLGALILVGVLANVALLNYTFDVPVKLFSTNLLLMAMFVAAPDAKRLFDVLVRNRVALPRVMPPLFARRGVSRAAAVVTGLFVAYVMSTNLWQGVGYYRQSIGPNAPKSALYGIWDVESFTKNGVERPPLLSDSLQLRRIVFGGLNRATFRTMSDSVERYTIQIDSTANTIALASRFDPKLKRTMSWQKPDSNHLVLAGQVSGDSVVMRLRRFDEKRFLLTNRGFKWIQELPFNR
jgi:hypothetical protein